MEDITTVWGSEEIIVVIIAFLESAKAMLQINGELSATVIPLNRGLKQGSVLSPILFNIFFGVLTTEFELHSMEETILGVNVQFNLADGFRDDTQIRRHRPGMRTATVVNNVLYADDCVLFTNTIGTMQLMIVQFDEVSILFGMELAISKTKIVCNQ